MCNIKKKKVNTIYMTQYIINPSSKICFCQTLIHYDKTFLSVYILDLAFHGKLHTPVTSPCLSHHNYE